MTPLSRRLILVPGLALGLACHEVHFEPEIKEGEIELYDDLFAVAVPSEKDAVAVGYRAAIYTTEDGGDTWLKRRPPTDKLLYDVSMADAERGWVVGQLGTLLRSEDGGVTWTPQSDHFPTGQSKQELGFHLFSVHAIDANTAWAVGEWGTRIYTNDGGVSWQDQSLLITTTHPQYVWLTPPEQERVRRGERVFEDVGLNDVYCLPDPSESCWIVGEFGYIFWSDDRGRNWQRAEIVGTEQIEPVVFAYDETEIPEERTEDLRSFVEKIIDEEHLNVEIEPFASPPEIRQYGDPEDPFPLFDILDARARSVRAVVEETGILSDRLRMRGSPPWDYEDYLGDDPGFLERYLESRTRSQPQVALDIAQNPYLFRVRFSDEQNGIITGLGGVVLVSDDGGRTWQYSSSQTKQALYALAPQNGSAIAVGEKGLVRVTANHGRSWSRPAGRRFPETFTFMRDLDFSPGDGLGLIVGQRGLVMRTTDGGTSWQKVLPPASEDARATAG